MWSDERRPYRPKTTSWSPWWIAAALLIGILIGLRTAGGPSFFTSALKRMPPASPVSPHAPFADRPTGIGPESTPALPAPLARPRETERADTQPPPLTRTIFHCKSYGGQTFWSNVTCSEQRATIDRIVTVPGNLGWNDAVAMGEQNRRNAEGLRAPGNVAATAGAIGGNLSTSSGSNACRALATSIEQLDATARQPQSPAYQDQLRRERQQARDRQSAMRC